jgi:hypothetical protein
LPECAYPFRAIAGTKIGKTLQEILDDLAIDVFRVVLARSGAVLIAIRSETPTHHAPDKRSGVR